VTLTHEEATTVLLQHRLLLNGFVATVVRSFDLAEDVFQDVCMKLLLREEPFESRDHVLKWARVACRNKAIDLIRSRERRQEWISDEDLETLLSAWTDDVDEEASKTLDALAHCLDWLTANNRKILQMRYFEGRSSSDVAEVLGRKPTAVYQALTRIHSLLERCIQMRLGVAGGGSR